MIRMQWQFFWLILHFLSVRDNFRLDLLKRKFSFKIFSYAKKKFHIEMKTLFPTPLQ